TAVPRQALARASTRLPTRVVHDSRNPLPTLARVTVGAGMNVPLEPQLSPAEEEAVPAELLNRPHVMADEQNGSTAPRHIAHRAEAFLLELEVADGEDLIDDEDFRLQVGGHG